MQLPQQSYCSRCPPGYSAGEGREGGSGLQQETLLCCPPSSAWHHRRATLAPYLAHSGHHTACLLGSHGSESLSGWQASLCPPNQGQGMLCSPKSSRTAWCQPPGKGSRSQAQAPWHSPACCRSGAGGAQPTLCGHEGPFAPAAAEGRAEAGQGGCPGACCIRGGGPRRQEGHRAEALSPELSWGPLLPCPGMAQRCCVREHSGGAGVGNIRASRGEQTLLGAMQTECERFSQHSLASAPALGAGINRQDWASAWQGVVGLERVAARQGAWAPLARKPNVLAKLLGRIEGTRATMGCWVC